MIYFIPEGTVIWTPSHNSGIFGPTWNVERSTKAVSYTDADINPHQRANLDDYIEFLVPSNARNIPYFAVLKADILKPNGKPLVAEPPHYLSDTYWKMRAGQEVPFPQIVAPSQ